MDQSEMQFNELLKKYPRFKKESYQFVMEALFYTQKEIAKRERGSKKSSRNFFSEPYDGLDNTSEDFSSDWSCENAFRENEEPLERHISGQELCYGAKKFALEQYGFLAPMVLSQLGLIRTSDIGDIVYYLIGIGQLNKNEQDSRSDFDDVFDLMGDLRRESVLTLRNLKI